MARTLPIRAFGESEIRIPGGPRGFILDMDLAKPLTMVDRFRSRVRFLQLLVDLTDDMDMSFDLSRPLGHLTGLKFKFKPSPPAKPRFLYAAVEAGAIAVEYRPAMRRSVDEDRFDVDADDRVPIEFMDCITHTLEPDEHHVLFA